MGDGGATMIVRQTRASQPGVCVRLLPTGISSYPEEEPWWAYGTSTLIAGDDALRQDVHSILLTIITDSTLTPHLRQQGGRGTDKTFSNMCQGYSLGNGASL